MRVVRRCLYLGRQKWKELILSQRLVPFFKSTLVQRPSDSSVYRHSFIWFVFFSCVRRIVCGCFPNQKFSRSLLIKIDFGWAFVRVPLIFFFHFSYPVHKRELITECWNLGDVFFFVIFFHLPLYSKMRAGMTPFAHIKFMIMFGLVG